MPRKGSYVPKTLRDMRAVFNQNKNQDTGPAQRRLRDLLEKSPHQYLVMMHKMEGELRQRREELKRSSGTAQASQIDEGSDRIEELLKHILEAAKCPSPIEVP